MTGLTIIELSKNSSENQISIDDAKKRHARLAISAIFLVNGMVLSTWVSRIPTITEKLSLGNAATGTALMAIALGSMVAFPMVGRLLIRRSSASITFVFAVILAAALPLAALAPSVYLLIPALMVLGFGNGGMDVAMNSQGVEVENAVETNIMSSLHGFYSLGAFAGAGIGAGAAALHLAPLPHFVIISLVGLGVILSMRRWMVPDAPAAKHLHDEAPVFAIPPRALWLLGLVAFSAAVCEGAIADWSGLYLKNELDTSAGFAALGFASFQLAMLIGRFSGDNLVRRFGPVAMVRRGGLIASVGVGIALMIGLPVPTLIGFMAAGLGLATAYPLAMSAAGNFKFLPRGQSVASVATVGYTGFLAGPPVLGWIAHITSLTWTIGMVSLLCLLVAVFADATRDAGVGHADDPAIVAGTLPAE